MTKPDFIIIGAMKSATSTLHEQLALQAGIFMSTPKEPNYFSDDEQYQKGESWYQDLFNAADENDLCGESSTHYTKLPDYPDTVERMGACLEQPKLIYVMRHPVDRLVSHYIHQWSQNIFKCDINEAINQYEELVSYGCYAQQLQPYFDRYGQENILPVFMEKMKTHPQQQLERIAAFIGCQSSVEWKDIASQNVSNERIRSFYGHKWLIESKPMSILRRALVPRTVRNKIKQKLIIQERPEINSDNLELLTKIFDDDLLKLKDWLDLEINCNNYYEKIL